MRVKHYSNRIVSMRKYAALVEETFKEDLENAPWQVMEIDDKYHYWSGLLSYIIDEHVPIKRKRVRTKDVLYMTKKWKDAIRVKRKDAKQFAKEKLQKTGK